MPVAITCQSCIHAIPRPHTLIWNLFVCLFQTRGLRFFCFSREELRTFILASPRSRHAMETLSRSHQALTPPPRSSGSAGPFNHKSTVLLPVARLHRIHTLTPHRIRQPGLMVVAYRSGHLTNRTLPPYSPDFMGTRRAFWPPPRVCPPGICAFSRPMPTDAPSDLASCKFSRDWPCR